MEWLQDAVSSTAGGSHDATISVPVSVRTPYAGTAGNLGLRPVQARWYLQTRVMLVKCRINHGSTLHVVIQVSFDILFL